MYWEKFYKKVRKKRLSRSKFADFVLKKINKNYTLIDFGCGDGRDSFYFAKYIKKTIGIDSCRYVIKENNLTKNKNIQFLNYNVQNKFPHHLQHRLNMSSTQILYAYFEGLLFHNAFY